MISLEDSSKISVEFDGEEKRVTVERPDTREAIEIDAITGRSKYIGSSDYSLDLLSLDDDNDVVIIMVIHLIIYRSYIYESQCKHFSFYDSAEACSSILSHFVF